MTATLDRVRRWVAGGLCLRPAGEIRGSVRNPIMAPRYSSESEQRGRGALKLLYRYWASTYDRVLGSFGYKAPDFAAEALREVLGDLDRPILDVGCGTGLTAKAARAQGATTLDGLDFSLDMLRQARGKGLYRHLVAADVTKPLPFREGAYPAMISSGLFAVGHIGTQALTPILGALERGGVFAFTVHDSIWRKYDFGQALETRAAAGEFALLVKEKKRHFEGLPGQNSWVVALRKS